MVYRRLQCLVTLTTPVVQCTRVSCYTTVTMDTPSLGPPLGPVKLMVAGIHRKIQPVQVRVTISTLLSSALIFTINISTANNCTDLAPVENTFEMFTNGSMLGSRVKYTCVNGTELVGGSEIRECLVDGNWSGTPPLCVG